MSKDRRITLDMMTVSRLSSALEKKELSNHRLQNAAAKKDPPKPAQPIEKKK